MPQLATLGQPMPQGTNMGTVRAQLEFAKQQQELAQALLQRGYVPNSGALGAIAQMFSAYQGRKLNRKSEESVTQALTRAFEEERRQKQIEAEANDPVMRLQRAGIDPNSEEGRYFQLTGKLPEQRGPMNVAPGGAIVDPKTGKVVYQAAFKPETPSPISLQSVQVPDGRGGTVMMNFNPRTGQYTNPFGGTTGPAVATEGDLSFNDLPEADRAAVSQALSSGKDFSFPAPSSRFGTSPPKNAPSDKSMPIGALKEDLSVEEALQAGQNALQTMKKHLRRIGSGNTNVSNVDAAMGATRRFFNSGTEQDANLVELKADLTKIVNDSLRLNKGVQTEGDAQRAFREVMDSNDETTLVRALSRLTEINARGIELQKKKRELIRRNYGKGEVQTPAPPSMDGWSITPVP